MAKVVQVPQVQQVAVPQIQDSSLLIPPQTSRMQQPLCQILLLSQP